MSYNVYLSYRKVWYTLLLSPCYWTITIHSTQILTTSHRTCGVRLWTIAIDPSSSARFCFMQISCRPQCDANSRHRLTRAARSPWITGRWGSRFCRKRELRWGDNRGMPLWIWFSFTSGERSGGTMYINRASKVFRPRLHSRVFLGPNVISFHGNWDMYLTWDYGCRQSPPVVATRWPGWNTVEIQCVTSRVDHGGRGPGSVLLDIREENNRHKA